MKVGLTGATGLLGTHLVPALLEAGHEVLALARPRPDRVLLPASGVEWLEGDLHDVGALSSLAERTSAVIHGAFDPVEENFVTSNLVGSIRLLEACTRTATQFVFVSSLAIYGDDLAQDPLGSRYPRDVDYPLWPREFYGAYKAAVEKLVHASAVSMGLNAASFRLGWVLGARPVWARNALAPFVDEAAEFGELRSRKGGFVLSVQDAARILAAAVGDDELRGTRWNVFDRWLDFGELAPVLSEVLGRPVERSAEPCPRPENPIDAGDLTQRFGPFETDAHVREILEILVARRAEGQT